MYERKLALATDLYELTMAAAYFEHGLEWKASFELFTRKLNANRSFLLCAGLEQALDYLENLHFETDEIEYLRTHPAFQHVKRGFFEYLQGFQFTGEVWAVSEGTPIFPNEPLLRVTAPIIEAQVIETFLLATINFQTMIASKAARVVQAARGRSVLEFGGRRAHGSEAALYAARASYIAGCAGTSNVEAGILFDIPTSGTIAHAFIMAFDDELEAFQAYLKTFPDNSTLLIDTYDTVEAARKIVRAGIKPQSVRLDSGDLLALSKEVRAILDEGGLTQTRIFASSDLDEDKIDELLKAGAPIDAFGVGTQMSTSYDAPALGGVYKLVEIIDEEGKPEGRMKMSASKSTYPFSKQVWRFSGADGIYSHDRIGLATETDPHNGEPLLIKVMENGKRVAPSPPLKAVRQRAIDLIARLPDPLSRLEAVEAYPVEYSARLIEERDKLLSAG